MCFKGAVHDINSRGRSRPPSASQTNTSACFVYAKLGKTPAKDLARVLILTQTMILSGGTYFSGTFAHLEVSSATKMTYIPAKEKVTAHSLSTCVRLASRVLICHFQHVGCRLDSRCWNAANQAKKQSKQWQAFTRIVHLVNQTRALLEFCNTSSRWDALKT